MSKRRIALVLVFTAFIGAGLVAARAGFTAAELDHPGEAVASAAAAGLHSDGPGNAVGTAASTGLRAWAKVHR